DLQLASATTPGPLQALLADATGSPIGFTATSSHLVYLTDLPSSGGPLGTLKAKPLAGGNEVTVAPKAALARVTTNPATLLFIENVDATQTSVTGDLAFADIGGGGQPKVLVQGADITYDHDDKNVYFTVPGYGLYYQAIP